MSEQQLARIEFTNEQQDLIKRTICVGASNDELALFLGQCRRTGLDPFSRQIHAVKRWNSDMGREVMTIQTGIDGLRLIAERTGKYAGNDDPQYDREDAPHPKKATVTVWKMVDGQRVPFTRSARWAEFVQTKKNGDPTRFWAKMPYLMLGKVAEALALRAAFPQELSGLYTPEEMSQADSEAEPAPAPVPVKQLPPKPGVDEKLVAQAIDAINATNSMQQCGTLWTALPKQVQQNTEVILAKEARKAHFAAITALQRNLDAEDVDDGIEVPA